MALDPNCLVWIFAFVDPVRKKSMFVTLITGVAINSVKQGRLGISLVFGHHLFVDLDMGPIMGNRFANRQTVLAIDAFFALLEIDRI